MKKKKVKHSEKIAEVFELPKEEVLTIPCLKVFGDGEIFLGNYGGIIDYNENFVSFATSMGIVEIKGYDFIIKSITDEDVSLSGKISQFEIKEM